MTQRVFIVAVFLFAAAAAHSQQGPFVPCTDCDLVTSTPYPRTGLWSNPDQPGTGINIEIQDGRLAGTFYGYDDEGRPDWRIFNGRLIQSDKPDVLWEVETVMSGFEGGACPGCVYQEPLVSDDVIPVRLEFQQPHYLQITFADAPSQFFVPFMFGTAGKAFFEESSDYLYPVHGVEGNYETVASDFVLVYRPKPVEGDLQEHLWRSFDVRIRRGRISNEQYEDNRRKVRWSIVARVTQTESLSVGNIECISYPESAPVVPPRCLLEILNFIGGDTTKINFAFPSAWFGDSRIYTEGPDGSTLEGFRLDYD